MNQDPLQSNDAQLPAPSLPLARGEADKNQYVSYAPEGLLVRRAETRGDDGSTCRAEGTRSLAPPDAPSVRLPASVVAGLATGHLPGLDGLRAVAVFLVILYHAGFGAPGGLGVLMFFVISGFLITWLLLKEYERRGTVSLHQFYWRRVLRIVPAFYVYWLLMLGIYLAGQAPVNWPQAIASLLYVNN